MGYPWIDGDVLSASDLNAVVVKHHTMDNSEASTTNSTYTTLKTFTIPANTFKRGFWVYVKGYFSFNWGYGEQGDKTAQGYLNLLVNETQKIEANGMARHRGDDACDCMGGKHEISYMYYVDSSDANWTPTENATIKVQGKASTCTVTVSQVLIWGE